jgi:hypothetical protein
MLRLILPSSGANAPTLPVRDNGYKQPQAQRIRAGGASPCKATSGTRVARSSRDSFAIGVFRKLPGLFFAHLAEGADVTPSVLSPGGLQNVGARTV